LTLGVPGSEVFRVGGGGRGKGEEESMNGPGRFDNESLWYSRVTEASQGRAA